MNEMNFYTLNGEQYEVADKKAREANTATNESLKLKADISYMNQAFAPALPITLNGAAVSTDMVSPIEHEVSCKVERLNEFTINDIPPCSIITGVDKSTNTFSIINTRTQDLLTLKRFIPNLKVGDTVIVKWNVENAEFPYLSLIRKGATQGTLYNGVKRGPITQAQLDSAIRFYGAKDSSKATYSNIKASINRDLPKEYYPYVPDLTAVKVTRQPGGATFNPDASGNVRGIISKTPDMSISTDNPNVTVEATYNADTKKYIDKKFSELQAAIISTGGNV